MTVGRPDLTGSFGGVASTHWIASSVGMAILERGGNAFDAAVAAGFVLQVVEPHSNGLGGDVAIAVYSRSSETVKVICGQGPMPRAASIEAYTSLGLNQIPGSGLLPACVPGAFGAWLRLLAEFGTITLGRSLEAAIDYATRGYPLLPNAAATIAAVAPLFRTEWSESGRTYLPAGTTPPAGSRMRNPALAHTMERILREAEAVSADRELQIEAAHRSFYHGFVAERIEQFVRTADVLDSTGRRHRGLLSADDLAAWRPEVEDPAWLAYGDYSVFKPGPWSQGPVFLQQLAILRGCDLRGLSYGSTDYVHTLAEAAKLAFADREGWYGDPCYTSVPLADLLDPDYSAARRSMIGQRAATTPQPGSPADVESWIPQPEPEAPALDDPEWMAQLRNGMPTVGPPLASAGVGNTCTIAAVDDAGNLVVAVPSGGWLKSSPVIPGLGFPLGTRGQTMWLEKGHPNSVEPGKRPRTTLSPTIVLRDGAPFLAMGTPGGDQQDQWTLEAFLAVVEFGMELQTAVEAPAFHIDHFPVSFAPRASRPGVVVAERSHGRSVLEGLRKKGHQLDIVPAHSLGKICAVEADSMGGFLRAAAGPRSRQAYAVCR